MALNFSTLVYLPAFDIFARPITVTPKPSIGGPFFTQPPYSDMRGIFDYDSFDVVGLDGASIISDQKALLYLRAAEFKAAGHPIPDQGDIITIPIVDDLDDEAVADWEVMASAYNGGGELEVTIRKRVIPAP